MNYNHRNRQRTFPYSEGVIWPGTERDKLPMSLFQCFQVLAGESLAVGPSGDAIEEGQRVAKNIVVASTLHPRRAFKAREAAGYGDL